MFKIINFVKIIFLLQFITSCAHKFETADLVVHNAKIFTSSVEGHKEFQAMAIKNGRIIDLGPEREILNKYNSKNQFDARKRVLIPGFIPVFNTKIKDSSTFWKNGFTSFVIDSLNFTDYHKIKPTIKNTLYSIYCNYNNIEKTLLKTKNDSLINKIIFIDTLKFNVDYVGYLPSVFISNQEIEMTNFNGQKYSLNHAKQSLYNIVNINNDSVFKNDKNFTLYYDNTESAFNVIEKISKSKSVLKAIDNFTLNSAILNNIYNDYGSLEIGKKANFITLDYNIFKAEKTKIHKIKILHTFVEGQLKYTKY